MVRFFRHNGKVGRWLVATVILLNLGLGCKGEPAKSTDTEAARREIERYKKEGKQEWNRK